MMDGEFVKEFRASLTGPYLNADDRLIVPPGWTEVKREIPTLEALKVGTLTGLVAYVGSTTLGDGRIVHVKDPGTVEVRGDLEPEAVRFRRHTYLVASTALVGGPPFPFGQFVDAETFFIGLQAGFVQTAERDQVLEFIARIRENTVRETIDSGVSQEVRATKGVALVENVRVPNPVTLAPYRTFREVDQPASQFIFRLAANPDGAKPKCALFEADGGTWKLVAIQKIAAYLTDKLPAGTVVLA